MRLRRVAVSGFKTFARRSEVILEPGITAIVGPNGSGKSNLVDAIRWALGETNARELRGARMDEVIYSGGGGRGRMGFAEVELVLDNEDGRLPMPDTEVAVSRRVVRHGESEYRLNGDRVRLRDLERLLGGTGLTQSGYAVVAQNDIDAIIEASPAQRRALVEQAAGVRSLRAASEDALGRVGSAEATLRRFEDLLAETEPRLEELAAQAALALEQRELAERLAGLRGSLAREAWRSARAQLRRAERRLEAAVSRMEAARMADAAFTQRLGQHRAHLERLRSRRQAAAAQIEEARVAAERARGELRRRGDQVRAGVLQRATAALEQRSIAAELDAAEMVRSEAATAAAAQPTALAEAERRLGESAQAHATAVAQAATSREQVDGAQRALRRAEEQRSELDAGRRRDAAQLRVITEAASALEQQRDEIARLLADLTASAEAAQATGAAAEAEALDAERTLVAAATELASARAAVTAAAGALDEAREGARVALARAAALRGQVEGAVGGRGAIADAVDSGDITARRVVDSFTVPDAADAAAVEAALEHQLGSWIVSDLDAAASRLGGAVAREELLRAAPNPSTPPAGRPSAEGIRAAIDAIVPSTGAEAVLQACLAGVWLCPDPARARAVVEAVGGTAVTPDGTVFTRNAVRGGGRPGRTVELAATERRAEEVAASATATERAADAVRREAQETAARAEAAERRASDAVQEARLRVVEIAARARSLETLRAAQLERLTALEQDLAKRASEGAALEAAVAAAAAELAGAGGAIEDARSILAAALDRQRSADAELLALEENRRHAESALADFHAAAADQQRRLSDAQATATALRERIVAAERRVLEAELLVLAALAARRHLGRAAAAAAAAVEEALAGMSAAEPDLSATEQAVAGLELERSEVAVALARAQDEEGTARAEVQAAGERVAELADAVRGDEEDDGPEPQEGDADRAEREIVRLERRIAALGPVNALAPEDHERLSARVVRLREGRDDLGTACADIRALAARLISEVEARFDAVFGAVSVHFHELFAELFPGGRATLRREMPEAEDEADAPATAAAAAPRPGGVEILAQPPGKRLQPLSLFSGGERALTALAVILALQQVNPSPFYVFDEVDAPLDDSNVLRFCRLLKRLAEQQQFIVVTHNHLTMAAADALHGVTSDGDGVSSIISVRFDPDAGETVAEADVMGLRQSTIRAAV